MVKICAAYRPQAVRGQGKGEGPYRHPFSMKEIGDVAALYDLTMRFKKHILK